jgi:signal transduction histidine kinase
MRMLLFELAPPVLEKEGLAAALLTRLKAVEDRAGASSELIVSGESHLTQCLEQHVYDTVLEALNYFLQNSQASHVLVRLAFDDEFTAVSVQHDDTESDHEAVATGLHSVEQHVERLDGRFSVTTVPGQMTRLDIEVPT